MKQFSILIFSIFILIGCRHKADIKEIYRLGVEIDSLNLEIQNAKNGQKVVLNGTEIQYLESAIVGQQYQLKIGFPRGYSTAGTQYPVLYVTDAETNFGAIHYAVQRLIKDGLIPPMLVVGIAYDTDYKSFYKLRSRDLTPLEDNNLKLGGAKIADPTGGANDFIRFFREELFPYIKANYHTDNNLRTCYGHSYGGLFGSHVLLHDPALFNRYLILSPSLWYYDDLLVKQSEVYSFDKIEARVFMGSGELEGRIDDLQELYASNLKTKIIDRLTLVSKVYDNG